MSLVKGDESKKGKKKKKKSEKDDKDKDSALKRQTR